MKAQFTLDIGDKSYQLSYGKGLQILEKLANAEIRNFQSTDNPTNSVNIIKILAKLCKIESLSCF